MNKAKNLKKLKQYSSDSSKKMAALIIAYKEVHHNVAKSILVAISVSLTV